jgi:hypothetical protein
MPSCLAPLAVITSIRPPMAAPVFAEDDMGGSEDLLPGYVRPGEARASAPDVTPADEDMGGFEDLVPAKAAAVTGPKVSPLWHVIRSTGTPVPRTCHRQTAKGSGARGMH